MNKIKVTQDKIDADLNSSVLLNIIDSEEFLNVKKLEIEVKEDASIEIEYDLEKLKIDFEVTIKPDVTLNIYELGTCKDIKMEQNYYLNTNSKLNIEKFYDNGLLKEFDNIYLNGENSEVNFDLKTIATNSEKFNIFVYHNNKNTISNLNNHGVNVNGDITFNVTGIIGTGNSNSETNQNNRIITFNDKKCIINPKLYIDENDVVANHSALIGKFDQEELFYLQSRGIDYKTAIILLVKGFLLDGKEDERLNQIIEKYWR
jgi:Fe-S cluster assembly protein SufD